MAAQVVPVRRHALPLHLVLEHDRLHPAADEHRAQGRHLRRSRSRRFALYAATANISIPLVLTLIVWFTLPRRGHPRARASSATSRAGCPPASRAPPRVPIFVIEVISHFVRIISLSVRLFANILAGHLLILFMGGGLVVLLGIAGARRRSRCRVGDRLLPLRGAAWSPPCRPSSSPPSPPSTSAAPSPSTTSTRRNRSGPRPSSPHIAQAADPADVRHATPARRSRSASAPASARSARASASATSSAR